jgi:hypothetical protein
MCQVNERYEPDGHRFEIPEEKELVETHYHKHIDRTHIPMETDNASLSSFDG